MTTGVNYLENHNGALQQSCLAAVTDLARADSMGSVYWAGLKTGDTAPGGGGPLAAPSPPRP